MSNHPIQESEQNVLNQAFDAPTKTIMVMPGEFDGSELQRSVSTQVAQKIVESGSYIYICIAPPGTLQSADDWQCERIDTSVDGTTVITWADGNAKFDNVATDPTALTYS